MNKVHINPIAYLILLISFLSGYFNYIFILLFLIFVHELGHMLIASLIGYKIDKIILYPFGGITKYNELLNTSMKKEFFVLLGGPLIQILLFLLLSKIYKLGFISDINYSIIESFHKTLLYFNLLPIIPLDGSKMVSLVLERIFSYKTSNILLIIISFISIFVMVIFEKRLIIILLAFILIKDLVNEIAIHNIKFNKFILERYLYIFNFKEGKIINDIKRIKRSKKHKIIYDGNILEEKEYLNIVYKKNKV